MCSSPCPYPSGDHPPVKHHPPSSDIWDFRRIWKDQSKVIMDTFWRGEYCFDIQKKITLSSGETVDIWSSRDALVLKVFQANKAALYSYSLV